MSISTITKLQLGKYSPDQSRDWHGRFGAGANPMAAESVEELEQAVHQDSKYESALARVQLRGDARRDPGVLDSTGHYSNAAREENINIAQSMINPRSIMPIGQSPSAVIMLGKPGSGKSTLRKTLGLNNNYTVCDADEAMAKLPGYEPELAGAYHGRGADIVEDHLIPMASNLNANIVVDMTGKNPSKMMNVADDLQTLGYRIHVVHASVSDLESGKRVYSRWKNGGRLVPVEFATRQFGNRPSTTYQLLKEHYADTGREYDTGTEAGRAQKGAHGNSNKAAFLLRRSVGRGGRGGGERLGQAGRGKEVRKYSPDQPRDAHGRFGSGSVIFEVAPDPDEKEKTAHWNSLTDREKQERSEQVAREYIPKILDAEGIKGGQVKAQIGSFENDTNSSFTLELPEDADPTAVVTATKALGYTLSQKSMMTVSDKEFPGSFPTDVITIENSKDFDLLSAKSMYDGLRSIKVGNQSAINGQTTNGNRMSILNIDQTMPTKELVSAIKTHLESQGGDYNITVKTAHVWFPSKAADYGSYGGRSSGGSGEERGQPSVQGSLDRFRDAVAQIVSKAIRQAFGKYTFVPNSRLREEISWAVLKGGPGSGRHPYGQTRTPEFKQWFGNSKAVDNQGRPVIVYHGTKNDFSTFDSHFGGSSTGEPSGQDGFYFSDNPKVADTFAGRYSDLHPLDNPNIMPVHLKIENPLVVDGREGGPYRDKGDSTPLLDDTLKWQSIDLARKNGNDGIVFRGFRDSVNDRAKASNVYFVFHPTQIKSAIGNSTFDPDNPDITKANPTLSHVHVNRPLGPKKKRPWSVRTVLKSARSDNRFALTVNKIKSHPVAQAFHEMHRQYEPRLADAFLKSVQTIKNKIAMGKLVDAIRHRNTHMAMETVGISAFKNNLEQTVKPILFEAYHAGNVMGAKQLQTAPVKKGGPGSGPRPAGRAADMFRNIMAAQRSTEGLRPAIRHEMTGEVFPAQGNELHNDIIDRVSEKMGGTTDFRDFEQGFITRGGNFVPRDMSERYDPAGFRRMAKAISMNANLNVTNPDAVDYLSDTLPELAKELDSEQMKVVQQILLDGMNGGTDAEEIANRIKRAIGLTQIQAQWVQNFRDQLISGEVGNFTPIEERRLSATDSQMAQDEFEAPTTDWATVNLLTDKYASSLLSYRSMSVAVSELHRAFIQGQDDTWHKAQELGYLNPDITRRHWLAVGDDRTREDHMAAQDMNEPDGVGLDEPFQTPWGDAMNPGDGPDEEAINCRCTVFLSFNDEWGSGSMKEDANAEAS